MRRLLSKRWGLSMLCLYICLMFAACGRPVAQAAATGAPLSVTQAQASVQEIVVAPGGRGNIPGVRTQNGQELWRYAGQEKTIVSFLVQDAGVIYAVIGKRVDASNPFEAVLALRARDGKVLWNWQTAFITITEPQIGTDTLYIAGQTQDRQNLIVALNHSTGQVRWKVALHTGSQASIVAFKKVDNALYVVTQTGGAKTAPTQGTLLALDPASGAVRWSYQPDKGQSGNVQFLVSGQQIALSAQLAASTAIGGPTLSSLQLLSVGNGHVFWHIQGRLLYNTLLSMENGTLFIHATSTTSTTSYYDLFQAIRLQDGSIRWRTNLKGRTSTPVLSGATIYAAVWPDSGQGPSSLLALNSQNGQQLWFRAFHGLDFTSAALTVSDSAIYLNDNTRAPEAGDLRVINAKNGQVLWTQHEARGPISWLQVQNGTVYAGLRGQPLDTGDEPWDGGALCSYRAATGATNWCKNTSYSVLSFVLV